METQLMTVSAGRAQRLQSVCQLLARPFIPSQGRMSVNPLTLLVEADGGIAASHFYGSRKFCSQMFPQPWTGRGRREGRTPVGARSPQVYLEFNRASFIPAEASALQTDILFVILFLMKSLKGSRGRVMALGGEMRPPIRGGVALHWEGQVSALEMGR